jgi:flagellar hook assembly protein FlgD
LIIYNILGQEVRRLIDESQSAGYKTAIWNGRDEFGREVGSAVYIIRLVAGQHNIVRKMSLQK